MAAPEPGTLYLCEGGGAYVSGHPTLISLPSSQHPTGARTQQPCHWG